MSASYIDGIDAVTGATRTIARLADVLGTEGAPMSPSGIVKSGGSTLSRFLDDIKRRTPDEIKDGAGTIVGAAAGALLWREHRVLGFLLGASLGRNVPALRKREYRRAALCNIGITGAGVLGSLKIPTHPAVGFGLGWAGGGVLAYMAGCNPVGGTK